MPTDVPFKDSYLKVVEIMLAMMALFSVRQNVCQKTKRYLQDTSRKHNAQSDLLMPWELHPKNDRKRHDEESGVNEN